MKKTKNADVTQSFRKIVNFYDLAGRKALALKSNDYGSRRMEFYLNAPYQKAESCIERSRQTSQQQCFLDLCCGTGPYSVFAAKLGYMVFGNDLSGRSIAAAERLASANQVSERCQFILQDAEKFLDDKQNYDFIFVSGSMAYLNRKRIFPKIYGALRPEGTCVIIDTNGSNGLLNFYRRTKNFCAQYRDETTLNHLIKLRELRTWPDYFDSAEISYFDFFTLYTPSLMFCPPLAKRWSALAKTLDLFVLKLPLMKFLSFKFVFIGQKAQAS